MTENVECPYCGETFESKIEEGKHRAEKHVSNGKIKRKKQRETDIDITEEWVKNNKESGGEDA